MDERTKTVTSFRAEVDTLRAMEEKLDSDIQISKQELAKANKALQAADKERIRYEKELAAVSPKLLETTEKVKGVRKRVVEIQKQLEKRRAERATREQSIISLEKELRVVTEEERKAREQLTRLDSESESGVQLDSSKLAEYSSLREEVAGKTAAERAQQLAAEAELKSVKLRQEHTVAKEKALLQELEECTGLIAEYTQRAEKLSVAQSTGAAEKERLSGLLEDAKETARSSEGKLKTLNEELTSVSERVREAGDDRRRGQQEEKLADAVETMKVVA